jgi:mutual gliding-motility protein MglA
MASLNPITKELVFKVVFCGPGLGGKTTTLERLHDLAPPENRGQLVSLATASDRTLYFDFLPLRISKVRGLHVRLQLFTVPGQVHYAATRKLVLTGSDGIVFVGDAQSARAEANQESLEDLETNLVELGRSLAGIPHVMQWNKTDLEELTPIAELEAKLNLHKAPSFPTIATQGKGIPEVLDAITRSVVDAYLATVPTGSTQKIQFSPEGMGLAAALRDWTEGRERDVDSSAPPAAPPLTPRGARAKPADGRVSSSVPSGERPGSSEASVFPPTARVVAPPAAESHFSLAELFPDEERTDVRGIEELVTRGDTRGAVLACEMLVARALSSLAEERGAFF